MIVASPKRFRWGFAALGLVVVALLVWLAVGHKKASGAPPPQVVAVATAQVVQQDVPISVDAIGQAQAWQGVLIRPQVGGRLLKVAVTEGTTVKQGDLVAQIDPAPYEAALESAQGVLARDTALLNGARVDLARYQTLVSQDSIPRQQLDTETALVHQYEGTVQADQGSVAAAKTNLAFTRMTAPVTGRAGVRLTDPGNLMAANDPTGIITINQVSPIAVTFTVPQGDFQRLVDASDGFKRPMGTVALSQDTGVKLGDGELSIADNHVDSSTGTVAMKARFTNPTDRLWPGQFVNVKLTLQTIPHAMSIPTVAVNQGPRGPFVYVVGSDSKVSVQPVSLIATQDTTAIIKTGLTVGQTVVTDGQISLRPGTKVRTRPTAPSGDTGPGRAGGRGNKRS